MTKITEKDKEKIKNKAIEIYKKGKGKYTKKEALEMAKDDFLVDKGKSLAWDLTKEQKANQKKALATGTKEKPKSSVKKERKPNWEKRDLINRLNTFLEGAEDISNLLVTNEERQLSFSFSGNEFELTLVQKRKPKK